jgi:hypothetical protein
MPHLACNGQCSVTEYYISCERMSMMKYPEICAPVFFVLMICDSPPGRANPTSGGGLLEDACQLCPPGTSSGLLGASSCQPCNPGQFQNLTGQYSCQLCGAGKYNERYGVDSSNACLTCPTSAPHSDVGTGSQQQCSLSICSPGRYTPSANDVECSSECTVGAYCSLGVVTLCPPGSFNDQQGASTLDSCIDCPPGRAGNAPGIALCLACPTGQFQAVPRQFQCETCEAGSYQPNVEEKQ